jgi:hypothetical protein
MIGFKCLPLSRLCPVTVTFRVVYLPLTIFLLYSFLGITDLVFFIWLHVALNRGNLAMDLKLGDRQTGET